LYVEKWLSLQLRKLAAEVNKHEQEMSSMAAAHKELKEQLQVISSPSPRG